MLFRSVFIYDARTYDQRQELIPTITEGDSHQFGVSLAVQPNAEVLLIGAPGTGYPGGTISDPGAVYVVLKNNFDNYAISQEIQLTDPDAEFGFSVDISADGLYLFIGAPGVNKVHVYQKIETAEYWELLTTYTGTAGGRFGHAIKFDSVNDLLYEIGRAHV